MSNPFAHDFVRAQLAPGMGDYLSCRGIVFKADEDRCVEIPRDVFRELDGHGLTIYQAPEKKK